MVGRTCVVFFSYFTDYWLEDVNNYEIKKTNQLTMIALIKLKN